MADVGGSLLTMSTVPTLIELLSQTPIALQHLLTQIPPDRHNVRRVETQWSVKEWLCHLIDAQDVLMARFTQFETTDDPLVADYEPPPESDTRYSDREFAAAVAEFADVRAASIDKLRNYDEAFWTKGGRHQSFSPYSTQTLLGHMLNVDYAHLFSIEQIGLGSVDSQT
jgi:uncharacterized damage-inducible protein DinB